MVIFIFIFQSESSSDMPPTTKSQTEKWLIGQPKSVLRSDFILAIKSGNEKAFDMLPFEGMVQLPTQIQVLKLYWFLREEGGLYNHQLLRKELYSTVGRFAKVYWDMAGFKVVQRVEAHVKRVVERYDKLRKIRSRIVRKLRKIVPSI